MNYRVKSIATSNLGYSVRWIVVNESTGRWAHSDPFLTKEMAEAFLEGFMKGYARDE